MARAKKFVEVQLLYLQGNQVEGWSIQHELKKIMRQYRTEGGQAFAI